MSYLVRTEVGGDIIMIEGNEQLSHDLTGEQANPAVFTQQMTLHIIWGRKKKGKSLCDQIKPSILWGKMWQYDLLGISTQKRFYAQIYHLCLMGTPQVPCPSQKVPQHVFDFYNTKLSLKSQKVGEREPMPNTTLFFVCLFVWKHYTVTQDWF